MVSPRFLSHLLHFTYAETKARRGKEPGPRLTLWHGKQPGIYPPRPHPTPASSLRIPKGKHRLRTALPQLRPGGTSHENDMSRGLRRALWLTLVCLWDAYWKGYDPKVGAVLG